ncbi:MAG: MerR family transcriptional regulator [Oscillospiraceae bacterium]|nr:MerR family transcriptional regulator [Oscillospiraceae bacterium]
MKMHKGLMSIGDFAAYCGSTRQTMQYYDHIGLLDPIVVGNQGYRYYHPLQGHEVRLIHSLQECGCSLEEIRDILTTSSVDQMQARIMARQEQLELELQRIKREQIYLERFSQFLSWASTRTIDVPELHTLNQTLYFREILFEDPCELYSDYYYQMILRYVEFCKSNKMAIQQYPYLFYVSPEELKEELRLSKIICIPEDVSTPSSHPMIAPSGQYLTMRCHPEGQNREDQRKAAYRALFRYMEEHGLVPLGGSAELPYCIPPGLRPDPYRFEVILIMPVAPVKDNSDGGGKA